MSLEQALHDHGKIMQQAIDMLANLNESVKFLNVNLMPVAVEDIRIPDFTEVVPVPEPEPIISSVEPNVGPKVIDYAEVAKQITSVFQEDRAKVVNALAQFGAAKGPQLKPEDYAAFLAVLNA